MDNKNIGYKFNDDVCNDGRYSNSKRTENRYGKYIYSVIRIN